MPQPDRSKGFATEELTASQRQAVNHFQGPLLVLAGPGSGKTRVITNRIEKLIRKGVAPNNICAVTFTNRAAEEMAQRLTAAGAPRGSTVCTFHSLCARILRTYADQAGIGADFTIYSEPDQKKCMAEAIGLSEIDSSNFPPGRMREAVSLLKNRLQDADSVRSKADDFFTKTLARIYSHYQQLLAERNALDFDDLLLKTAFLLRDFPEVRSELNRRFTFLLVDEYQDTNHAQYHIARSLVIEHGNICVTGDPDQSIYRWRGADINNILQFEKDWPNAVVIRLQENFRSTPNILSLADRLISFNQSRKEKTLIATKPKGDDVVVTQSDDEAEEAQAVARRIEELLTEGAPANSIAVFYRVNAMSRPLEEAFIRNKIQYQIVRGVQFYNRKEIRDMLAYLKVLVNPADELSLLRIINTPARGIGKTTISRLLAQARRDNISLYEAVCRFERVDSLANAAKTRLGKFVSMIKAFKDGIDDGVVQLAERVYKESGLADSLDGAGAVEAVENVRELINGTSMYEKIAEEPTLADYLQQIALFTDSDAYDGQKGAVALMTLHCAKGLEFENVFIVGLEQGILPHQRSGESQAELEEERRLFFVGATRAKSRLYISYARHRTLQGQLSRTIPSQFLFEAGIDPSQQAAQESAARPDEIETKEPEFSVGQMVKHPKFGRGVVEQYVDMGADSMVVVRFRSGQTKSLMLKYARLSRLQ